VTEKNRESSLACGYISEHDHKRLFEKYREVGRILGKIEGVFGNWYLDPDDPAIKNRDNLEFRKERYHCK